MSEGSKGDPMTPDEAMEAMEIIERLGKSGFVVVQNGIMGSWFVRICQQWKNPGNDVHGETLLAALRAAEREVG